LLTSGAVAGGMDGKSIEQGRQKQSPLVLVPTLWLSQPAVALPADLVDRFG